MLHHFIVCGLFHETFRGFEAFHDRNSPVHLDKFRVIISLCYPGFGPLPAQVYGVACVGAGIVGIVYGTVCIVNPGSIPVQGQEILPVLRIVDEEMRGSDALVIVLVKIGQRILVR